MSDIALPAGMALMIVSLGLAALAIAVVILSLIVGLISQRRLPFRRRRAFQVCLGMLFVLLLAGIGVLFAEYGPSEPLRNLDRGPLYLLPVVALLIFFAGLGWGLLKKKNERNPGLVE